MTSDTESRKQRGVSITVNQSWCKSCGICIEFCPQGVLLEGELGSPKIGEIDKCNVCRLCELRCPEMAIIVAKGA